MKIRESIENTIDKAVGVLSPIRGNKRLAARVRQRAFNSGYGNYGASESKAGMKGWLSNGGSADEDIQEHLEIIRERSRDLYMGVPLATGALKTMRTNVVGSGLALKSQIDYTFLGISEEQAQEIENTIEREFALWCDPEGCDIERTDNFFNLQQLAFLNWLMSGDVFVLLPTTERVNMPYDIRVQLVEADLISDPPEKGNRNIVGGVELNRHGEVFAYHILNKHPLATESEGTKQERWKRVKAFGEITGRRNVIHIMNRERIGQRRGVPFLAPVIETIKQLGRYTEAEIMAAVVSGMFAVFIEKKGISSDDPVGAVVPEEQQIDAGNPNTLEVAPGVIIDLNEGEEAKSVSPGRPNSNFDGFVVAVLRQIGAALEIPHEVLVKDFDRSYSASRAALLELWKSVKMYRGWMASSFCQPIFEEWLAEAVAKGRINAPGFFGDPAIRKAYSGAEWNGPAQGSLNPIHDVTAAQMRVNNGFSTRDREAQELTGSDFYKNVQQRKREEELMKEVRGIESDTKQPTEYK